MAKQELDVIPGCAMDDPLPENVFDLIKLIRHSAEARRRAACSHRRTCPCTACYIRRYHEARYQAQRAS
jgi:hypothetical protein